MREKEKDVLIKEEVKLEKTVPCLPSTLGIFHSRENISHLFNETARICYFFSTGDPVFRGQEWVYLNHYSF